eukprot:GFUD01016080.1.p1 GENE.GFUD01016080.1~~GFUD01016080.1.p1  ORF type:complete len:567 (-),score=125.10 GFUD01016080.1:61-1761(-)
MAGNAEEFVIVKFEDEGEDETDSAPMEPLTEEGNSWYDATAPIPLRLKLTDSLLSSAQNSQSTSSLPSTEIWPGNHNMEYQIEDSGNWKKRGYAFSTLLNKLYIDMEKQVAIKFFIVGKPPAGSVIRAVPVYVDIASRAQPVLRCPVHSSLEDPSNRLITNPILKHLVRSSEISTTYLENKISGRLSLTTVIKDTAPGCDYFTIFYQFMCLGSCLGGLARRQLQMIFTLETEQGNVVGRQVMEVRICSCPLRDMKQEEQKFSKLTASAKMSCKDPAPAQIRSMDTLPHVQRTSPQFPILPKEKETESGHGHPASYGKDEDIFWVPVRGIKNYQEVNRFAEYLDLTSGGNCLTDAAVNIRKQRDQLMAAANPNLSRLLNETGDNISYNKHDLNMKRISEPEAKRKKLSDPYSGWQGIPIKVSPVFVSQQEDAQAVSSSHQSHSLVKMFQPIRPKLAIINQPTIFTQSTQSISFQPKNSLTHSQPSIRSGGNDTQYLNSQMSPAQNLKQLESRRQEVKVEDSEEEEGEMIITDSLQINNEDSNDGLNELRNKLFCKTKSDEGDSVLSM